jgi:TRAP-type mannitol/chloroaromatic compound transport system permease small subunit
MRRVRAIVERVALAVLLIGGVGMLAAMFLGTADVVGTQFLKTPVPGALELTESTMTLIVFGALAYAQIRRAHIRVELLYTRVGRRARIALDMLAHVAALLFFGLLLWQAIGEAIFSWNIDEATVGLIRFPLYPARWILVLGTALLLVQLVLDVVLEMRRLAGTAGDEAEDATVLASELQFLPEAEKPDARR